MTNKTQQEILYNALTKLKDEFISTMSWSHDAKEYEKTLVICNLNGFCGYLARVMPEEAKPDLSVLDSEEAVGRLSLKLAIDDTGQKYIEIGSPLEKEYRKQAKSALQTVKEILGE